MKTRVRSTAVLLVLAATCLTFSLATGGTPAGAAGVGGPVIIMGIDGEDGGPGGHGPIAVYETMINTVKGQVANGGSGILVIGGGHSPTDSSTLFWNQVSADTTIPVTYLNGPAISTQSFAGYAIIVVAGSESDTSGGLTDDESTALATRSFDIATFVNGGGGLYVLQQGDITAAYGFLGDIGTFVSEPIDTGFDDDIDPTPAGIAAGLTDDLDVCCWHDKFTTYPSFLTVLAVYNQEDPTSPAEVAALGGAKVQIPTGIVLDPTTQSHLTGETCAVTATITENELPSVGKEVRFSVTAGPNAPKTGVGTSDSAGKATFSYVGANVGDDTIVAEFTDTQGRVRVADPVTCTITAPPTTTTTAAPTTTTTAPPVAAAKAVVVTPHFTG